MGRNVLTLALLAAGLANAGPLRAGVYSLDAPPKYPSDFVVVNNLDAVRQVMIHLGELRAIDDRAVNPQFPAGPDSLRVAYLKQLAALEEKRRTGTLDPADRVNLGACLIRLGRFNAAQVLLNESLRVVPADCPERFLLSLNLAAAYQEDDDQLQRAIDTQQQALRAWPVLWRGWTRWENNWYHRAEEHVLAVMRLRQKEIRLSQGRPSSEMPRYYDLFPGVQFVGASGEYEAGGIAFEHANRLPADAEMIVLQLLLWRPTDNRLSWLYGELLNVRGQVDWAFEVLNYLDKLPWSNRELRRHHRVLKGELPIYEKLFADPSGTGEDRRLQAMILWALAPRGGLTAGGIGPALNELGGAVASTRAGLPAGVPLGGQEAASSPAPPADVLPDWRIVAVSFAAGAVVAVLLGLQWQQWRRRRILAEVRQGAGEPFAPRGGIAGPSSDYSRPRDG